MFFRGGTGFYGFTRSGCVVRLRAGIGMGPGSTMGKLKIAEVTVWVLSFVVAAVAFTKI